MKRKNILGLLSSLFALSSISCSPCDGSGTTDWIQGQFDCMNEGDENSDLPADAPIWATTGCGIDDVQQRDQNDAILERDDGAFCADYNYENDDGCDQTCRAREIRKNILLSREEFSPIYLHRHIEGLSLPPHKFKVTAEPQMANIDDPPSVQNGGSILKLTVPCDRAALVHFSTEPLIVEASLIAEGELYEGSQRAARRERVHPLPQKEISIFFSEFRTNGNGQEAHYTIPHWEDNPISQHPLIFEDSPLCQDGFATFDVPITEPNTVTVKISEDHANEVASTNIRNYQLRTETTHFIPFENDENREHRVGLNQNVWIRNDGNKEFEIPDNSTVEIKQAPDPRYPAFFPSCAQRPGRSWAVNYIDLDENGRPIERTVEGICNSDFDEMGTPIPDLEFNIPDIPEKDTVKIIVSTLDNNNRNTESKFNIKVTTPSID